MKLFTISNVIQQTAMIRLLQLTDLDGKGLDFLPGQHVDINLAADEGEAINQYNSFSIASSPFTKEFIEIIVLDQGAFRHKLYNAPSGTTLVIKGPYGRFIYDETLKLTPVFIAGGSGIAPIMSMIRHVIQKRPEDKLTLIYSCKTEADIIFPRELNGLARTHKGFHCLIILTRPATDSTSHPAHSSLITGEKADVPSPLKQTGGCGHENRQTITAGEETSDIVKGAGEGNWLIEFGHIDESTIVRNIRDVTSRIYYICGPYEMMIMIGYILQKLGVESARVNSELW